MKETIRQHVEIRRQPTVVRLVEALDERWALDSYHLTGEVQLHVEALRHALSRDRGTGAFLVGPYGSGKSHFLAWLTLQLRSSRFLRDAAPDVVALSMLHYSGEARLEVVIAEALGVSAGTGDRREAFAALQQRHPTGVLLVIDELSEFLRSKPDRQRFTEDIRYLQFLGEWAQDRRFFVLAAMQEAIEHTGDLEHALYRKIKDRYPLRLRLTQVHVEELIADHLLVKKSSYAAATEDLLRRLADAVPGSEQALQRLRDVYPLHPTTLRLLEEVRDRFSQTRGVVDFVSVQLGGSPERGIEPFLDRPWGEMVTPDRIVDHFHDILQLQPEFQVLAQTLLPWYERHLAEMLPQPRQRELAWRLLKLLVVTHLSPSRDGLTADEAVWWLMVAATRIDPARNRAIVERLLQTLVRDGRYLRRRGERYTLDLQDDRADALSRMLKRELAELPSPSTILERLGDVLSSGQGPPVGFNPLVLPRDRWQERTVRWHFHERDWSVYLGNGDPSSREGPALCVRLPWGDPLPHAGYPTLLPAALEVTPGLRELVALVRLRERAVPPDLAGEITSRIDDQAPLLTALLRQAYADGSLVFPDGSRAAVRPPQASQTLDEWLGGIATLLLRRRFPSFERFAPQHSPLPGGAYRELMRHLADHEIGAADAPRWVSVIREAYLVPMGLLKRTAAQRYAVPARLDRNELVRLIQPMVETGASIDAVYRHLAGPVYGLVDDQIHLLLAFLAALGEVDVLKGTRSYREIYETMPTARHYDRVVAARGLGNDALQSLAVLCEGLRVKVPSSWTVQAQKRAVSSAGAAILEAIEPLRSVRERLPDDGELSRRLDRLLDWCAPLQQRGPVLEIFERFRHGAPTLSRFLEELAELSSLPRRIQRQTTELQRYRHLLSQPGMEAIRAELGDPPGLEHGTALDGWLRNATGAHEAYKGRYRAAHDEWWQRLGEHPGWRHELPALARVRHLGLGDRLAEQREVADRLRRSRCQGLSDLDFQSRCSCGFDGESGPVQALLERAEELVRGIEQEIQRFFSQRAVLARVQQWHDQGIEVFEETQDYLAGRAPWPRVEDLEAFDEHLAGVEVVRSVDSRDLLQVVLGRTWEAAELRRVLDDFVRGIDAPRLRIEAPPAAEPDQVAPWCVEQALRFGAAVPGGLGDVAEVAGQIDASWVGARGLANLDRLGLGQACVRRVLGLVVDGQATPGARSASSVQAAMELVEPSRPDHPEELAAQSASLYRHHEEMIQVAPRRWLARLEGLAASELSHGGRDLPDLLTELRDASWLVIDAFGLPLLDTLRDHLDELFPGRELARLHFATVPSQSTTERFYASLAEASINHALHKINAVDELLHQRAVPFPDLCRLSLAELHAALGPLRRELDSSRPWVVLGDHGFRLDPAGRRWVHGGASTLERVVPVMVLTASTGPRPNIP